MMLLSFFACHQIVQEQSLTLPHWTYEGIAQSENWGSFCTAYKTCIEGQLQSPINIETSTIKSGSDLSIEFNYIPTLVDLVNNGHSFQANVEANEEFNIDNHCFSLQQFHFHEPSEHHLDGIIFPMELHFVHEDDEGNIAVVGVFVKEGKSHPVLEEIMNHLPSKKGEHHFTQVSCDLLQLMPEQKSVFHYTGSLTTPPCSEGIEWFVMEQPIELSKTQIDQFKKHYHNNNRPIQNTAERLIEMSYFR